MVKLADYAIGNAKLIRERIDKRSEKIEQILNPLIGRTIDDLIFLDNTQRALIKLLEDQICTERELWPLIPDIIGDRELKDTTQLQDCIIKNEINLHNKSSKFFDIIRCSEELSELEISGGY